MTMGSDDISEKTIISSDTFKKSISVKDQAPPAIVMLWGPPAYQGKQWALIKNGMVIGRAVENDIYIDERSLSRAHAKFEIFPDQVRVIDMDSTNKTMVNGNILAPYAPYLLNNNDEIRMGSTIFKFLEQGSIEAITNQNLYDKANRDALTGAYSKGFLLEKGPEVIRKAESLNEPLSMIVFDIDYFKKINDGYGHPGGDHVLKELGKLVQSKLIRSNDFFARYGGEEFVLLLTATTLKLAFEIGERIRQTIQNHEFLFETRKIPVAVSLGVAERKPTESDWGSFFKRADEALYVSKQSGRNRVTIAP
ncbi:MAG: diguanylate cyclase [Pseudobdellovibrionaceae bacterium]